jgi:hypothetical protein
MADHPDLSEHQAYVCGSPAMVAAARRDFVARLPIAAGRVLRRLLRLRCRYADRRSPPALCRRIPRFATRIRMTEVFMSRQPLVNRQSRIIATRLTAASRRRRRHAGCGERPRRAGQRLATGENRCSSVAATAIDARLLDWSAPENATIELPAACAARRARPEPDRRHCRPGNRRSACISIRRRRRRCRPACRTASSASTRSASQLPNSSCSLRAPEATAWASLSMSENTADFRACMDAGMTAAAGWFFTTPSGVPAKDTQSQAGEHRAGAQPGPQQRRHPGNRSRTQAGCRDFLQAAALHQFSRFWPVLRDPVVPPCRQHARLRQAQPLVVAAAGNGKQGPDGTGA